MSFTPPNHARALFLSLFFIWLYIASVMWWHAVTVQRLDLLNLAESSLDLGVLVYGVIVVHRLFWINLLPFSFHVSDTFWGLPAAGLGLLHGLAVLVLLGSLLILLWAWYHARRDRFTLQSGLSFALLLATPLVVYELARSTVGIDIFETLVAVVMHLV